MKGGVEREQRVYASLEPGAQIKMLNSSVLIQRERDGRKEVYVEKLLLLFRCSVKGQSDGDELAFVLYMKCVAPLHERDEALNCVCL